MTRAIAISAAGLIALTAMLRAVDAEPYPWPHKRPVAITLAQAIAPPPGFIRQPAAPGSFAHWLRGLPMKPAGSPVKLHNGGMKWRQDVHTGVIDIDTGTRDLQQCADAVMRLRAEWLRGTGRAGDIAFNDTGSGKPMSYARWAGGERPRLGGKSLTWSRRAKPDDGYRAFRSYMNLVFAYAGTYSLSRELSPVKDGRPQVGDVFIKGGFPGHAVLVADRVTDPATGEARFLLVQSYMPAQDMHVLKNPAGPDGSPWYPVPVVWPLVTPEWTFPPGSLKRWR